MKELYKELYNMMPSSLVEVYIDYQSSIYDFQLGRVCENPGALTIPGYI